MPTVQSTPRPLLSEIGLAEAWRRLTVHFAGVVWQAGGASRPYGKLLLTVWSTFLAWVAVRSLGLGRRSRRALRRPAAAAQGGGAAAAGEKPPAPKAKVVGSPVWRLLRLLRKHIASRHGAYFVAYVLSLCTRILITVKLADYGGMLAALMGAREFDDMFRGQARFGLWCMAASCATAAMKFLEKRVTLSLRSLLYREMLQDYVNARTVAYYHAPLQVSDPPARVTSDLDQFSSAAVHTLGHMLKPVIDTVHLCVVIGSRIGLPSLLIFLSFFGASQHMLKQVQGALPVGMKELSVRKQELEAQLRSRHQLLHDFREQVALQKGTDCERKALLQRYHALHRHGLITATTSACLDVISTYVLKYGGAMCGFSVLIPGVYFGDPKRSRTRVTSEYLANSQLLQTLAGAIKDFADAAQEVPRLSGLAARVEELTSVVARLPPVEEPARGPVAEGIKVRGLSVAPPGHEVLLKGVSFDVPEGQHTVVSGPNGCGKTSLFRTICGVWAPPEPPQLLQLPPEEAVFAVPQESYFPFGCLRQQLTYPHPRERLPRQEAVALLCEVGLDDLAKREGGVDAECDWRVLLSGGQKQRLAWARMLYHRPRFAMVDEGTSAVAQDGIDLLHGAAKSRGITLFSVSHHPFVDRHHDAALKLSPGGVWELGKVSARPM
eukprot:TRINITY_DN17690_c0_g1_i1.p1 TRINITY_DN17690_c0_g1~~TRINITY_DN17690_c0_g1_i1.p1  ORF type:complete len:664 (+),score=232.80 TRINITY_DN17690_c0_g1_i1:93-2084(+)